MPYNLFVGCFDFWEVSYVFGKHLPIFELLLFVFSSVMLHIVGRGHYQKQAHAQLLPHRGPFLWWCPWPRALPSSVSSFCLPSPHQFSLCCGLHSYFTSKSAGTIFLSSNASDWTVTRVCDWSFFVISFRLPTVVKSSIGQGIRICSNPSQVVTCFVGFITMVLNIKVQFWFTTIWFSNIWEVKLRPAKLWVLFWGCWNT